MGVFDDIYEKNHWGFGSGHGSLPEVTQSYRQFLESFIRENNIGTVVDVGCGDWQFSRLIDWGEATYLGVDVVDTVVQTNQQRFATERISFKTIQPGSNDAIPSGDLLIIKDVLQHLPDDDVHAFVRNVLPRFRFALVTNCILPTEAINAPIASGGFRPLDLRREPFNVEASVVLSFTGDQVFSEATQGWYGGWEKLVLLVERP